MTGNLKSTILGWSPVG